METQKTTTFACNCETMDPHQLGYILITFAYVVVFAIIGATMLLLHIPEEKGMESYRKARKTLGGALVALSLYCMIRLIFPQHHHDYQDFWLLVTFTLIHSWLTYASLLFLLETPRYVTRRFLLDGAIPAALMLLCGFVGVFVPVLQPVMQIIFGCIFGIKCAYMFYTCLQEYRKCKNELDNYYDENPHISWIKGLIFLSLFMSAATVVAFYVTSIHLIYYISIPFIYAFIAFKIVDFAPKKIDVIRRQNSTLDKPAEAKNRTVKGIDEKVGPMVDKWVSEKKFCAPELNIKDVATEVGTNSTYLSQYLNSHLGQTFQLWLNSLRIEESKALLTDGSRRSIEEVGIMVGFSQVYNFSRWFRTVTGTTPLRFRQGR